MSGVLRGRRTPTTRAWRPIVSPGPQDAGRTIRTPIYHFAQIRGATGRYRVFGACATRSRTSRSPSTRRRSTAGFNGRVLADINDSEFHVRTRRPRTPSSSAPRSHHKIQASDGGNWVQLDPDARMLIVRKATSCVSSRPRNDPAGSRWRIGIEDARGRAAAPRPIDDATLAARLSTGRRVPAPDHRGSGPPHRARRRHSSWARSPTRSASHGASANAGVDAAGAVDILLLDGQVGPRSRRPRW